MILSLFKFEVRIIYFITQKMKNKMSKEDISEEFSLSRKGQPEYEDFNEKSIKKSVEEYKCGKEDCGKYYHSYTAFYNHCKKSHEGEFPVGSLYNGKLFEGPSKNRGRPRIKKTDAKDLVQIESLKTENELIEFLGTLSKKKKNEELIVYVDDALEQLEEAIGYANQWSNSAFGSYLKSLNDFNKVVTKNDLPEFYDPIQISKYTNKLDSYNFTSIFNFFMNPSKYQFHHNEEEGEELLFKILVAWLARILSKKLLAEVIYVVVQNKSNVDNIKEKQYLQGKSKKLINLIDKYFECLLTEHSNKMEEKSEE